jgi:hypothetical protein
MRIAAALAGVLVLVSGSLQPVLAYDATATVTVKFGTVSGEMPAPSSGINANVAPGGVPFPGDRGWTANGVNSIDQPANDTYFTTAEGYNSVSMYNSAFAESSDYGEGTADDCLTPLPGYEEVSLRKYGCRVTDTVFSTSPYSPAFQYSPVSDVGPRAGVAIGTLTANDTTLTGTLTIYSSTDEPTGATITVSSSGTRVSASPGDGTDGYNYRTADGSPFGNAWYGVTTAGTLTFNLTGTFTATNWEIDGGTVQFTDPGFACAQGGFGAIDPDGAGPLPTDGLAGTLCTYSGVGGGFQTDGGAQSWGMDLDGQGGGFTVPDMIEVRDAAGTNTLATLSGVLASLVVDGSGNISTASGEFRRALGSASGGCTDHIRWDSAESRISCGTLTTGGLEIVGSVGAADTDPDAFSFPDATDVPLDSLVESDPATITGINQPAIIVVSGGEYSINCTGEFTAADGIILPGDALCLRHTSSAFPGTDTETIVTIGGGPTNTATFRSTTSLSDTIPDAFSFTDQVRVPVSSEVVSNEVTITGINAAAPISVTGGEYSIGCNGTFTATGGTVNDGDTVCVRHTSSPDFSTDTDTVLDIGGVTDTFTSTTEAEDITPDAFSFTDQADVPISSEVVSNEVTITGINAAAPISVSGGEYSIGCTGSFTNDDGAIDPGDTVCVRHTSSSTPGGVTDTELTVGGVSDIFSSTTILDEDIDGGSSSLDLLMLALLGLGGLVRRRSR